MTTTGRLLIMSALLVGGALWMYTESAKSLAEELGAQPESVGNTTRDEGSVLQQSDDREAGDPNVSRPQIGYRAPELRALTIDGTEVERTLRNYPGQVVVIYVWATWCGYCSKEMPSIEALYREFKGQGLFVLAVAANGDDELLRATSRERGFTFDVLRDDDKATAKAYGVRGYPMTVIVDRKGVIRATRYGYGEDSHQKNVALVRQLLAE